MNFYTVIPSALLLNTQLSANEKILYGIISSMTNQYGYCDISNTALTYYFEKDGVIPHKKTISKWVNHLIELGYLHSEIVKEDGQQKRLLRLAEKIVIKEVEKVEVPKKETQAPVNTDYTEQIKQIISYLNKLTHKNFKHDTKNYVKEITARLNQGRTLEDFMKVIESAVLNEWYVKNPQYFAPTTLFRDDKFDKHLAAWTFEKRQAIYSALKEEEKPVVVKDVSEEKF